MIQRRREVVKTKQKRRDEGYEMLDTKEGGKDLYHLARRRDPAGKDVQQVQVIRCTFPTKEV